MLISKSTLLSSYINIHLRCVATNNNNNNKQGFVHTRREKKNSRVTTNYITTTKKEQAARASSSISLPSLTDGLWSLHFGLQHRQYLIVFFLLPPTLPFSTLSSSVVSDLMTLLIYATLLEFINSFSFATQQDTFTFIRHERPQKSYCW